MREELKGLSARMLATAACFTITMAAGPASAETWRKATKVPADSFGGRLHQECAEKVKDSIHGDFRINVYLSGQFGDAQTVLEQVCSGIIDIFVNDVSHLKSFNPDSTLDLRAVPVRQPRALVGLHEVGLLPFDPEFDREEG
ncbi:hypothetical protein KM176_16350 [Pseudooceanicola sp. CBS1P-1]|uniref:C4-dicarboxylate ABC transporter substrate-binding protein n=1 Tax=Pseudooceanicola albus TaxID=2692189 RepID=A0A6L7G3L0_9RHOB|nr:MULTISPECIES: hypothetical protein [Pseudooceanicola]MBT9385446.1 hypothetical protein [Pseudooceanicola endophyticus]MXN18695.1 hypothetical protein [Pseudooceanicola albus]